MLVLADYTPALAQLTDPFDHLHVAVSASSGPATGTSSTWEATGGRLYGAWGKWPADHPLPIQLHFLLQQRASERRQHHRPYRVFIRGSGPRVDALRAPVSRSSVPLLKSRSGKQAVAEDPWGRNWCSSRIRTLGEHQSNCACPTPSRHCSGTCMHSAETARSQRPGRGGAVSRLGCFFCSLYRMPARDDRNVTVVFGRSVLRQPALDPGGSPAQLPLHRILANVGRGL